jgi:hypothetical protein
MKLVLLILGLWVGSGRATILTSLQSGLEKLGNSVKSGLTSLTSSVEDKLDTLTGDASKALGFGSLAETPTIAEAPDDQLMIHVSHVSLQKTQQSEQAIEALFTPSGELNSETLDSLLNKAQQQALERDYHMHNSKASVAEIIEIMGSLSALENQVKQYKETTQSSQRLVTAMSLNQKVYSGINDLFNNRTLLKKDMLVLSQNMDYLRRSDFDLSTFYFGGKYKEELDFLVNRPDTDSSKLYNIFLGQRDIFENRVNEMETIYQQFNRDMADIFENCEAVYGSFLARQKRAELVSDFASDVDEKLVRLFELRREFAEHVLIYQSSIESIAMHRDLFRTVFDATEEVKEVTEQILEIEKTIRDAESANVGLTPKQRARLEKLRKEAKQDELSMIKEVQQAIEDANDPTLSTDERKERAVIRKSKMRAYLAKNETRSKEIEQIQQSLKDAQLSGKEIDEQESDEEFFKRRAKEQETENLVLNLKTKIDNKEITMAEVDDRDIADRIAKKEIKEAETTRVEEESLVQNEVPEEEIVEPAEEDTLAPIDSQETQELPEKSVFDAGARKLLGTQCRLGVAAVVAMLALMSW